MIDVTVTLVAFSMKSGSI